MTENEVINSSLSIRQTCFTSSCASVEGVLPGKRRRLEKETCKFKPNKTILKAETNLQTCCRPLTVLRFIVVYYQYTAQLSSLWHQKTRRKLKKFSYRYMETAHICYNPTCYGQMPRICTKYLKYKQQKSPISYWKKTMCMKKIRMTDDP